MSTNRPATTLPRMPLVLYTVEFRSLGGTKRELIDAELPPQPLLAARVSLCCLWLVLQLSIGMARTETVLLYSKTQRHATLCNVMQSYATLCSVMPSYATLCKAMQHYAALCHAMQRYAKLCSAMQRYAKLCSVMPSYATLCKAMQCYATLCKAMQCYTVQCNII